MTVSPRNAVVVLLVAVLASTSSAAEPARKVGVAAVDITPAYNVRLNGFAHRHSESEGVTQKIWAKAIAIEDGGGDGGDGGEAKRSIVMAVDNLGVPDYMTREVAKRLAEKAKLDPARLAITSTHTHTAPMLTNCCPTIFGRPIPPAEQKNIDRYTAELTDHLEKVALAAIADLKPGRLEFGIGSANLAMNRRTPGGPVDHDLPVMVVKDAGGKLRAIYTSYACHCVTLAHNKISGDWAGYAQEVLQQTHPGVIALTSIGCGADANPDSGVTGDKVDVAAEQGRRIAKEVDRVIAQTLTPLDRPIATTLNRIDLPFDKHPTRAQWEERAKRSDATGHHARVQLARLDRGEQLQTSLSYPIQTWNFGDALAMVFLPGEVVVDYSLRLKKDFDRNRLWINGYSNDVPCYIPSERILKEGGYEAEGAMIYYDRPTRLASGVEQKVVEEVHRQVPKSFAAPAGTEGLAPRTAQQSLRTIRVREGLEVELVAAEPLVTSPVAIDWDARGRMWVCEMYDYPTGEGKNWEAGGRVRVLTDTDGDGRYDKAEVFLDKLPFPTGVTAWGKGAYVCAAPDIIYAEDTDGDGRADKVEQPYTGFATDNYQARVNSLALGLDNWIYGANGLLGGVIKGPFDSGQGKPAGDVDIRGHDFRFNPKTAAMETVGGTTQQGRARDDFGRWFGCDNSNALFYFPHEERYFRRNPHAPAPPARVAPPGDFDVGRMYPISRPTERFNHPESANRVTGACGLGVYRDTLLGDGYNGNTFTCEPVSNVVHRLVLEGDGLGLTRRRDAGERESEFLASTDHWFRPVQVRTGPDGALYVVDMYRFLIEHPRWIPAERLAQLDVRAGSNMGRIYRVKPTGDRAAKLRPVRDLTKLATAELAAAIDSPSGTERDRVHVELLHRGDAAAAAQTLAKLAAEAKLPQVRVQAQAALDGIGALQPAHVARALKDADAQVRKHAVRLAETTRDAAVTAALLALVADPSPPVRTQLAFTLGEIDDAAAGEALGKLAVAALDDADTRFAVLSSGEKHCGPVLAAVMSAAANAPGRAAWIPPLVATAAASTDERLLGAALAAVLPPDASAPTAAHFAAVAGLLDAVERRGGSLPAAVGLRVAQVRTAALRVAGDADASSAARLDALKLLGRGETTAEERDALCRIAVEASTDDVRAAALSAVANQTDPDVATRLLSSWQRAAPAARADVINLLLGREEWATALLHAVRDKRVATQELSLTDRQRLAESGSAALKQLAAETLPPASTSSRAEVLRQYAPVASLTGNPQRGQEVFAKNCVACHAFGGAGHDVGPDLAPLRDKDADYFVKNILDPNAIIEPRFVNYTVLLKDRRVLAGIIKSETATNLILSVGAGVTETVARAVVKEMRASNLSMMPEGLEGAISPEQMADLVAYLKHSSAPRKELPGNTPALVKQGADGSLLLPATKAEIYGDGPIVLESEFGNIGYWNNAADHVAWLVQVDKPGEYDVHFDYACADESAGNKFVVGVGPASVTGVVKGTGGDWSNYRRVKLGTLRLGAGQQRVTVKAVAPLRHSLIDLRTVAMTPAGVAPKWPASTRAAPPPDMVLRDAPSVARFIMDKSNSNAAREAAVNSNPQFAPELIAEMTRDLPPGPVEYERIPWIWRVSIAAGKRNQGPQLKKILDVSLPRDGEPLRDWQAVVIGGGVINGLTLVNVWPGERVPEILGDDGALKARWQRALDLASPMTDDEKTPKGTRYDALRMLGVEPWDKRGEQLVRYLGRDVHAELQMGAVSGAGDVKDPRATAALIAALPGLTEGNRKLALRVLVRDEQRVAALRHALEEGAIDAALLDDETKQRLAPAAR